MTDFLTSLFRVSDPAQARGRVLTAREVLDRGAARVGTELLSDAGRYDEAERAWKDALGRMERSLGPDHPDTARCAVGLGVIEVHSGGREAALRLLARAVAVDPRSAASLSQQPGLRALAGEPEFQRLSASGPGRP